MKSVLCVVFALLVTVALCEEGIMPRPPKRPGSGNELAQLIRETRIGNPQRYKSLIIYPLFSSSRSTLNYWTLDEALHKEVLRITEKGEGSVPELLVENRGDKPIFLLTGEIVKGGKQNRVISQDILLAPHSGPLSLSVFCVEQGRWTKSTSYFAVEKDMAHSNLRQHLNAPVAEQSSVWSEVTRKAVALAPAAVGETRYLGKIFDDRELKRDMEDYEKSIVLAEQATGMAVLIGGRVVGVELFGDYETFRKLAQKLVRSYAVDAMESKGAESPSESRQLVEKFLHRIASTRMMLKETVGVGQFFKIDGSGLYGSVLVWRDQPGAHGVVHASLFDESPVVRSMPKMPIE